VEERLTRKGVRFSTFFTPPREREREREGGGEKRELVYPFRIRPGEKIRPAGGTAGVARGFINFGLKFTGRRVIPLAIFRILLRRSARSRDFSQRWTARPAKLAALFKTRKLKRGIRITAAFHGRFYSRGEIQYYVRYCLKRK